MGERDGLRAGVSRPESFNASATAFIAGLAASAALVLGFVYCFGVVGLAGRFRAESIPQMEALRLVPTSQIIVSGAGFVLPYAIFALLVMAIVIALRYCEITWHRRQRKKSADRPASEVGFPRELSWTVGLKAALEFMVLAVAMATAFSVPNAVLIALLATLGDLRYQGVLRNFDGLSWEVVATILVIVGLVSSTYFTPGRSLPEAQVFTSEATVKGKLITTAPDFVAVGRHAGQPSIVAIPTSQIRSVEIGQSPVTKRKSFPLLGNQ